MSERKELVPLLPELLELVEVRNAEIARLTKRAEWAERERESNWILAERSREGAERAEADLREERAKLSRVLEQIRQAFAVRKAMTPGGGLAGILAGVDELADRAERAEAERDASLADNAALKSMLDKAGRHIAGCSVKATDYKCIPECGLETVLLADHPGAALLERLRALERVGRKMANACFNLRQDGGPGSALAAETRKTLEELHREWDTLEKKA